MIRVDISIIEHKIERVQIGVVEITLADGPMGWTFLQFNKNLIYYKYDPMKTSFMYEYSYIIFTLYQCYLQ